MEVKLSAVIITFNEERNIGRCLESLKDVVDEVVVVDSYSSDQTRQICEDHGAIFIQHVFHGHIQQKNWAIDQASFPHILSLDADECLSPLLKESICEVKANWKNDAYYFNRLTNYCGKWIRHTSWYPSPKLRLWDSRLGSWGGANPHDKFILDSKARKKFLRGDLLHYSYYRISDHIDQNNRFSTIAARSLFQQGKKSGVLHILMRPFWRFISNYILRLGLLDGFYGLVVSVNSAHSVFLRYVKLRILHKEHAKSQKQTICFFNSTAAWGGGEKWHFEVSNRLHREGHPIIFFSHTNGELGSKVAESGIRSFEIRVANLSFLNPIKILRIARILKREGVRLIIMNLSADIKLAGIAAKVAGVERIIYRRGSAIPIRNNFLNRILFRHVLDEVLANSYETKRTLLQNNKRLMDPSKIRVIYNGIKLEQFERRDEVPCYQGLEGEVILGNAGRLEKQKAQHYLVDLAVELKKRELNFKILIAGSGRLEDQLRAHAQASGVMDKIIFLGFIKNMKCFMESIDIFVLTSLWEGFGYVIAEAMANSKPVVAFDVSSNPEIIENEKSGFLIPPFDIELFANRVSQLAENKDLAKEFGDFAKASVYERFDFEDALGKVEQFMMENN